MRNALVIVVVGSSLCFAAPNTQALGFGRTANATQLGQALNFAAMIQLSGDETLARECVGAEVFSGENKLPASQVRVTLEPGNEPGERSIRVTSTALIDEPVVTINVSVGCGAKMSRRFVAFIDPPLLNLAQADAVEHAQLVPQNVDTAVAPLLEIVQAANGQPPTTKLSPPKGLASIDAPSAVADRPYRTARSAKADRPVANRPDTRKRTAAAKNAGGQRTASAGTGARVRQTPTASSSVGVAVAEASANKTVKPGAVSRLQLEPSVAMADRAAPAPSAAASALTMAQAVDQVAAAAVAASAIDSNTELLAAVGQRNQRIERLEEGTARLLAESKSTRDALAQMQSRMQEAESERYANPLVYALAALAALFAGFSVGLWRRQPRAADLPQWWGAGAESTSAAAAALTPEEPLAREPLVDPVDEQVFAPQPALVTPPMAPMSPTGSAWEASESLRLPAGSTRELIAPDPLTMPAGTADQSVDELIDLEQQAEFFIVLGQDEAATDLLMGHVRSSGGASPMPYLKLLEIYHRCDDREAYDRIRVRFNRRFDATAPEWGADPQAGRSLADYPELLLRLQAMWRAPEEVMHTLAAALFRRKKTDATVDLPAYSELLFLFTIARDLSGRELVELDVQASDPSMVDLLLPIDEPVDREPVIDMTVTRPFAAGTRAGALAQESPTAMAHHAEPLDFDLSLPLGLMALSERVDAEASLSGEPPVEASNHIDFNNVPSRPTELAYQR